MTKGCPCCGRLDFTDLLAFPNVPVSGRFRASTAEPVATLDLEFELCRTCGLVRQKTFARPPDYAEVNRAPALPLPPHTPVLIEGLRARGLRDDDLVLEVGSNNGAFLEALRRDGFVHIIGVEPSRLLAQSARDKGFRVENDYFGPAVAQRIVQEHGRPKAIICRHTLEHVPEPDVFVAAIRDCVDGTRGCVLLEIPDGSAIPELMNAYELWDEHFYAFCIENAALLLDGAGLEIEQAQIYPYLNTRNLVLWCRAGVVMRAPALSAEMGRDCAALWLSFRNAWHVRREAFAAAIREAPRPIHFVGASHSQTNFINFTGVGAVADFLIDDDPAKVGHLAPISGGSAVIISTQIFETSAEAGTVVLTGFGYPKWMDRICGYARRAHLTVIDPDSFFRLYNP